MRHALIVALFLGGCTLLNDPGMHMGNVRDAPALDAERVIYDDFCDRYADLACRGMQECCMAGAPNNCVDVLTRTCDETVARNLLRDGRTGYDPVIAAEVFAEAEALVATCDPAILDWARDSLFRMLTGTRAAGAVCSPDTEVPFDTPTLYSCADDNACIFNGIDRWTCQTPVGRGGACYLDTDCVEGLWCSRSSTGCAERLPVGAACDPDLDGCQGVCVCDDGTCASGRCFAPTANAIYCNLFVRR